MTNINLIKELIRRIYDVFSVDFTFVPSDIITTVYDNFFSLRTYKDHPTFSDKDTFFMEEDKTKVLRTQTTNFQSKVYTLYKDIINNSNINFFNTGTVFRKDDSSRHSYFFHQVDGLMFQKSYTIQDYIYLLSEYIIKLLNIKTRFRYRKSYFPFTYPSFEIDILYNGVWLEILGCGMIHYNIVNTFEIKEGFAFGVGIERLAMMKHNIKSIKTLRIL